MANSADGPASLQQQIDDMQSQLAFQEDTIHALDKVVSNQQLEINSLKQELTMLMQQLKQNTDAGSQTTVDEKPPHY